MISRRFRLVISNNSKPRDNLDIPAITLLLKQLKPVHKNVHSSQKRLLTEMHLLERVYYKGKNQHGSSLFWRSVVSARRMTARIYETNLPRLLEILSSIFHEEPFKGRKVFSGAWTRVPPPETIAQILERLLNIGELLKAAITAFQKAYNAFCLALPNTAFLQLTVVLVSIVSRNNALASTILDNLSTIIPRVYAVFEILEPPIPVVRRLSKLITRFSLEPAAQNPINGPTQLQPTTSNAALYIDHAEDIGSTVARSALPVPGTPNSTRARLSSPPPRTISPDHTYGSAPRSPVGIETITTWEQPQVHHTGTIPIKNGAPAEFTSSLATKPRNECVTVATPNLTKRKKVRNEIDDIFG